MRLGHARRERAGYGMINHAGSAVAFACHRGIAISRGSVLTTERPYSTRRSEIICTR
jgi:hypothetical protein